MEVPRSADYRDEGTLVISQVHGFCLDRMAEPAGLTDRNGQICCISSVSGHRCPFRRLGALTGALRRLAASTVLLVLSVLRPKAVEAEVAAGCS
jgi:hypothetical protein